MSKKNVRVIICLVIAAMIMSLFAACGTSSTESSHNVDNYEEETENSIAQDKDNDSKKNDSQSTDLKSLASSFYEYACGDNPLIDIEGLFNNLYDVIPSESQVSTDVKTETVTSVFVGEKEYDNWYDNYDYLFNTSFPATFESDRNSIFDLLHTVDNVQLQFDGNQIITNDNFYPVSSSRNNSTYGQYQRVAPNTYSDRYFYGDLESGKPSGKGIIFYIDASGNAWPEYAGNFVDGYYSGYGILWNLETNGIISEGYFNLTPNFTDFQDYRGALSGKGIVYYESNRADIYRPDADGPENTVLINYAIEQPHVMYEGDFDNGYILGNLSYFEKNNSCYGEIRYSGEWDELNEQVICHGIFFNNDGTYFDGYYLSDYLYSLPYYEGIGGLYESNGSLKFVGYLNGSPYENITLVTGRYFEDGECVGEYMNEDFTWL